MKRTIKTTAPTVEAALEEACKALNVSKDDVTYTVIAAPKKGFLGIGATDAEIEVSYTMKPMDIAESFIKTVLADMDIKASISKSRNSDGDYVFNIEGEEAGALIGHHGETLDSLQYLCNLAANKKEGEDDDREYARIVVDIGGYRAKREQTLRALAKRMAEKAKKYRRSMSLEPMPPHERRIIHSEIQRIEGVTTSSVGSENRRKVVIYPEKNSAR